MSPVPGVSAVSGVAGPGAASAASAVRAAADAARPDTAATGAVGAGGFAAVLARNLEHVQALQTNADTLAVRAATGQLTDVHDYTIAATQAQLTTEMTVTLRNKAVEAFNDIMRMQA